MRSARKNVLFSLRSPNLSPLGRIFTSLPDFARTGRTLLIFGILNVKTKMSAYANEVLKKEAQNMVTCKRLIMLQNRFQDVLFFVRKGCSAHSCLKSSPRRLRNWINEGNVSLTWLNHTFHITQLEYSVLSTPSVLLLDWTRDKVL